MPFFKRKSDKQTKQTSTPTSPQAVPLTVGAASEQRTPSNKSLRSDIVPNGDIGVPSTLLQCGRTLDSDRPKSLVISSDDGDLGKSLQLDSPLRTSSRLSKTFQEILHDKDAIPYFIQYMESKELGHLIRFWLDAESFQAATWTRIRTQSLHSLSRSSVARQGSDSGKLAADKATVQKSASNPPESTSSPTCNVSNSDNSVAKDNVCDNGPHLSLEETENVESNSKPTNDIANLNAKNMPNKKHTVPHSTSCTKHTPGTTNGLVSPESENCPTEGNMNPAPEVDTSTGDHGDKQALQCLDSSHVERSVSVTSDVDVKTQERNDRLSQLMNVVSEESTKARSGSQEEKFRKSIERDAVNIYSKYICLNAPRPIGISEEIRNTAISKMCREDGQVDPSCFAQCQDFVVDIMGGEHYPDFTRSVFHCKHQIDVLTSGRVYLADILYNEVAMFYFMEFMEQEGGADLLQCVLAADNFQQHLQAMQGYDGVQAQSDAMVLYDKYFSLQATTPLGFGDKIRFEVESNICREEGPLPDCFSIPRNISLKSIEKNCFPQFLKSELYYKYLSELVNTIQMAQDFPQQRVRKRTESDASSEHSGGSQSTGNESISMKNTLLASKTSHWKKALHHFEDDLRIDPVFFNPDALWKRSAASGMSLGTVDTLGQFVSEFEPEPDHEKKKSAGFFKKRKDKEKEQEEMALRIAEMIINDVTSVTQQGADDGAMSDASHKS